ncbi:MAG: glycosyltransferase [Bacteroidetes bacterium]|nr:glycosyltransferase [Bacteroidota bacterium]
MKSNNSPLISVLLPVYNAGKFLHESIESILNQTFSDFELIIINDGSKDNSKEIINSFNDTRIVFIDQENIGLAASLNKGLGLARGKFIARQDNDDISLSQRFEKQLMFFEKNPNVALLGTAAEITDEQGRPTGRFHRHSSDSLTLKFTLLFNNPFVHSSVMFRKSVIEKTGSYSTDTAVFEDYDLWSRIARVASVSNLNEYLLKYREVLTGMSKSAADYKEKVKRQSIKNIQFYCPGISLNNIELFVDTKRLISESKNHEDALSAYNKLLNEVADSFCKHEKIATADLSEMIKGQLLNFKRLLYNTIIYSDKYSKMDKLKASIARKWLFLTNKKLLN